MTIEPGKWTHDLDGSVVVFMVGMRVNRLRAVRTWWPIFAVMPRMLRELHGARGAGFLGHTSAFSVRGAMVVTYWEDVASLLAYAHDTQGEHRPAWAAFNRVARESAGVVGIWHETYAVPAGGHESLYVDIPRMGLAAATTAVPVSSRRDDARSRMARADQDAA